MSLTPNQTLGLAVGDAPVGEVVNYPQRVESVHRTRVWVTDLNTANKAVGECVALYVDPTYMPNGIQILGVRWLPGLNVTAHDTNYATVSVQTRTAAGVAGSTVSTYTTKSTGGSGNLTAFVVYSAGVTTAANAFVSSGYTVTTKVAKANAGVKLAAAAASAGDLFGIEFIYQIL